MTTTTMIVVLVLQVAFLASVCVGFQQQPLARQQFQSALPMMGSTENDGDGQNNRRNFLVSSFAATATGLFSFQQSAMAMPMATAEEFNTVVRDSPLSIKVVEFSGPKSETVVVKLLDGTVFGIKDVVESSIDPRSPLKIVATCKSANVKTSFVELEALLAGSPKKKKMYTNERVQKAYELQAAQKERIRLDELDRLAQVEAQDSAVAAEAAAVAKEAAAEAAVREKEAADAAAATVAE